MLELRNVVKRFYGGVTAVDHLSFEIPTGSVSGILGPNGAGKTTTIRMILNVLQPDEGEIYYDGRPIDDTIKNRVGYLPEERGLYPKSSVRDILFYFGELKNRTAAEVEQAVQYWVQRLEFPYPLKTKIEELSKGNQQKVQFMAAVVADPEIVILDEPFTGLDPINQNLLSEVILELKDRGKAVILCTHLLDVAERLCDRVVLINKGKQVLSGSLAAIKEQFGSRFVAVEFEGEGSILEQAPGAILVQRSQNYAELQLNPGTTFNALLLWLAERIPIRKVELRVPSLHTIFVQSVQQQEAGTKEEVRDNGSA